MTDFVVVKKHPMMVAFVDQLQRKNAEALSFYPKQVFERESERGRLMLSLLNGEPCGYLYMGSGRDGTLRCHQVCIEYDARRRLYGASLVAAMEAEAVAVGAVFVQLRCGFDLAANDFWASLGYKTIAVDDGGIRRMRRINVWGKVIGPMLFEPTEIAPERGKTSASVWSKHKQTGIVTQFIRGKAMAEYRAKVIGP